MKKTIRRIFTLCLSAILFFTCLIPVSAASSDSILEKDNLSSFVQQIRRCFTIIFGSYNEKADIEVKVKKEAVFTPFRFFQSAHASTVIKLDNGELVSAWFGGSGEGNKDVRIWYSIKTDGDWTEPVAIPTDDNMPHYNPVLQDFGSYIRLFYHVGSSPSSWVTKYVDSFDNGRSWTWPKELVEGDTTGGRGPVKNQCLIRDDGVIIAPASTEQGQWKAFFDISYDGGKTWTKTDYVTAYNEKGEFVEMIQPTLWQDKDGSVHAMFRTLDGWIYRSDSTDGGLTWCDAYSTGLMHGSSGLCCTTTDDGRLWLIYNPCGVKQRRHQLLVSVSEDNGETWKDVTYLERSPIIFTEYSYPTVIADGNTLHVTYTWNRFHINHATIEF